MPAPTMSHVVCSAALIALIFVSQFFYLQVVTNLQAEMTRKELKEIADHVSDTLANLYFLVNSTDRDVELEKSLDLPSEIRDSTYVVKIVSNASDAAQNVTTYLKGQPWIQGSSWLLPGLKVDPAKSEIVESGQTTVVARCRRESTEVYVWIRKL